MAEKLGYGIIKYLQNNSTTNGSPIIKQEITPIKSKIQLLETEIRRKEAILAKTKQDLEKLLKDQDTQIDQLVRSNHSLKEEKKLVESVRSEELTVLKTKFRNKLAEAKEDEKLIKDLKSYVQESKEDKTKRQAKIKQLQVKICEITEHRTETTAQWIYTSSDFESKNFVNHGPFQTTDLIPHGEGKKDWDNVVALWNKNSDPVFLEKFSIERIVALKIEALQQQKLHSPLKTSNCVQQCAVQNIDHQDQRNQILKRFENYKIVEREGAAVVPVWYGTPEDNINTICAYGFSNPKFSLQHHFGNGLYGTMQAEYTLRMSGNNACFLCFASVGKVWPLIYDDMARLNGAGTGLGGCDAHFVPVVPVDIHNSKRVYCPARENEVPVYDEMVFFTRENVLPRFVIFYKPVV